MVFVKEVQKLELSLDILWENNVRGWFQQELLGRKAQYGISVKERYKQIARGHETCPIDFNESEFA